MGQVLNKADTRKPDRRANQPLPGKGGGFPQLPWKWLLFFGIGVLSVVFFGKKPFIVYDDDGEPDIAPWRKERLKKEVQEFKEAEQYALLASESGYFLCFSCFTHSQIYLFENEVWKYGVTRKGEKGRYNESWLIANKLYYDLQFKGSIERCLIEEKRKIYYYPLLPENLKRQELLMRPPGNKNDN